MGGIRGVLHYMQRTAVQGTPDTLTALGGRWVRGSRRLDPGRHPFRLPFHELRLGDTFDSAEREVSVEDIERFAALSGDTFYAHMSETEAARNPLVRRPCRARIFSDLRRGGPVRRPRLRPRARQLRPERAAVRQAGEARGPDQGAAYLRPEKPAWPTRAGARSPGTRRSPITRGKPWRPTMC